GFVSIKDTEVPGLVDDSTLQRPKVCGTLRPWCGCALRSERVELGVLCGERIEEPGALGEDRLVLHEQWQAAVKHRDRVVFLAQTVRDVLCNGGRRSALERDANLGQVPGDRLRHSAHLELVQRID